MTDRRTFVKLMAASSGALLIGIDLSCAPGDGPGASFEPSAWLRLDGDGSVLVRVGKSEMGQGVRTSLPMIVAEEMDADFGRVRIAQASPGPDFQNLGTGGSFSLMGSWKALRHAGALARTLLVAAAAARWDVPPESCRTEAGVVIHEASGRRLSYGELAESAARQPVPEQVSLKPRSAYTLIGTPRRRIDAPDMVAGDARYGLDVRVPEMLYAAVARSPALGGTVASFDDAAARRVPGVREVVRIGSGLAVVAEHTWAALRGRDALRVDWASGPGADFDTDAHRAALRSAVRTPGVTIRRDGRGRAGFARAARTLEAAYDYPFEAHAPMEPMNATAHVRADGTCEVWTPSQTPNTVQAAAAKLLGIPRESVTVHVTLIGGGFGRRLNWDFDTEALQVAAALPGTPVQVVWSREDDMRHGHFQAGSAHWLRAGLDAAGRVTAWEHREASSMHNTRGADPSRIDTSDPDRVRDSAWGVYDTPYHVPDFEATYRHVPVPVNIGPWRAVFSPPAVFARECFLDEVAEAARRDPIELRLEMLGAGPRAVPARYEIEDEVIDRGRLRAVIERVRDASGWDTPVPAGHALGMAANFFHTETHIAYVVEVSLRPEAADGDLPFRVHRVVCALDCGLLVNPLGARQQVESGVIWSLSNMKSEMTWRGGIPRQATYGDFRVVTLDEAPDRVETHFVDAGRDDPNGIGEPVVCPLAPAVANALFRLTGRRIRGLPVRRADVGL
ncbi:MAG: molybdopterin-dependent oxidoreductase [Candidatus Palauibacterales bacterium]|nr:molybdopterin-dependent oxidoreductase [Candidatus Palauibacterales bacterium]MDP2531083.1 molybdopterin-dependent oxidoreductase [Candidatus Palauibacterales bacterium]MDP2582737.1 molybdopterin-dependent oxidoreductase [Candidatus Palauibacterales bacterium]